jgi:hypothetical protein
MVKKNSNGSGKLPPAADLPDATTAGNPPDAVVVANLLNTVPDGDPLNTATVAKLLNTATAGDPLDSAATITRFNTAATVTPLLTPANPGLKIPKPSFMAKYKSKRPPDIGGVETVLTALKIMRVGETNDFFRLHPDEDAYWSCEMCFVSVPILGQKRETLHTIDEDLAMAHLSAKQIKRHRVALATKPHDVFFLCIVPSQNLDNTFNSTALIGCERGRTEWVQALSRKAEGVDEYYIKPARDPDAFPAPKWPSRTRDELLEVTFHGFNIDVDTHPALLRLIGAKQNLK